MLLDKKKQGHSNVRKGREFEKRVRTDLEKLGWIVTRWTNNVDFPSEPRESEIDMTNYGNVSGIKVLEGKDISEKIGEIGRLIPAKQGRFRKVSTGFPDFIAFSRIGHETFNIVKGVFNQIIIGVECKSGKSPYLDKEEKAKAKWLLANKIFSKFLIAKKGKKRGEIVYEELDVKNDKTRKNE